MEDKLFELEIITPDRQFYEGTVNMVEMTTSEGNIGIYKNHIPLTCILKPGVVKIYEGESSEPKKAIVHAGFVEILKDKVIVMAEIAEWPDEIDVKRAEEARVRAERRLTGSESGLDIQRAEVALKKSLTRISLKN